MGLDMYLTRRTSRLPTQEMKTNGEVTIKGSDTEIKIKATKLSRIRVEEEVGYWRKANQIHNWFDNQIEEGIVNCQEYYFSIDQLTELREVCKQVLADKELAENLLPSCDGFFFGETDYDECYFEELEDTVRLIDELEKQETESNETHDYSYMAWW